MKYKLRGDYCFKTSKNEILRNKCDKEGNVLEVVIIDSKQHEKAIAEQLHMLEAIVEKKPEVKAPVNPPELPKEPVNPPPPELPKDDQQPTNTEPGNTEQQSLPLQGGSGTGTGKKGNR